MINQSSQENFVPMQNHEKDINLLDLLRVLIQFKWIILAVVFFSVLVSIVTALSITPVYRAEILLAPATNDGGSKSGIAALASQFGGFASLAGIAGGGGGDIETVIATLKSRKFIADFIDDIGIKQILFENLWDDVNKRWISTEPSLLNTFKAKFIPPQEKNLLQGEPSTGTVYKKFSREILKVAQDNRTQLLRVSIVWKNPQQSSEWANFLIKRLNDKLRQKTIDEAERSIAYLTEQISQTSLSELQNVLYRLIEEHMKVITLAKVNDEYVMKVIDPAVPPEASFKPNRKFIVSFGLLAGVVFGVFLAFFLNAVANWKDKEKPTEE